jgi:hypothetical protein
MNQTEPGIMNNIQSGVRDIGDKIKSAGDTIATTVDSIRDTTSKVAQSGVDTANAYLPALPPGPTPANGTSFSFSDYTNMSSEFLESNSYIARTAFILLVIFTFFVLLRLGTALIKYFIGRSTDPVKLIDGMTTGTSTQIFQQGIGFPNIYRSNNEMSGIEFTWVINLNIEDQEPGGNKYRHIFSKGSLPKITGGNAIDTTNQAPGLYFDKDINILVVKMDVFNSNKTITIETPSIPHNKWVTVMIRCKNTVLDVYINGQIIKSVQMENVPKQNYGSVYLAHGGSGFKGNISNFWYYKHALSINEINALMKNGVNLNMVSPSTLSVTKNDYLGLGWFVN